MPRIHHSTLPIDNKRLEKVFRAWGWKVDVSGTNHAKWSKNGTTVTARRGQQNSTWEPVTFAAKLEGVTPEVWLQGPKTARQATVPFPTEDDINFFVANRGSATLSPGSLLHDRFKRIRSALAAHGVLAQYEKLPFEPKKVDPLPTQPDAEGYITLDEALALRGSKQGVQALTSCQIISALSLGDIHNKDGGATTDLLKMTGAKVSAAGFSGLVKKWEEAGLVWRAINGKRTYKIGLTQSVRLTDAEKDKYLKSVPKPERPKASLDSQVKAEGIPPKPNLAPAIEALNKEKDHAIGQIAAWQRKVDAIALSIQILEAQ